MAGSVLIAVAVVVGAITGAFSKQRITLSFMDGDQPGELFTLEKENHDND